MAVYTSYAAISAPHLDDARVLPGATGQAAWSPNFTTLKDLMPPILAGLSGGGASNSGWISVGGVATGGGGTGTVTSVGLSAPAEFSVSGSPVTSSGTLSFGKANQSAATVYAGPATGAAAAPTFRALAATDVPNIAESQVTGLTADLAAKAPLASPSFTGNPQGPVFWIPVTLAANLIAPNDCRAHIPGTLSIPSGLLVDLSASSGHTLLEVW